MAETPASVVPGLDLESEPSSTAAQLKATTEATQATLSSTAVSTSVPVDPELEEIKKKVREMEAEAKKLADMQKEVEMAFEQSSSSGPGMPMSAPVMHQPATPSVMFPSLEEKIEADARSIYGPVFCQKKILKKLRLSSIFSRCKKIPFPCRPSRVRGHGGRSRAALPRLRRPQPRHHPLRQVHRPPQRLRLHRVRR